MANCAFSFCAACPFDKANEEVEDEAAAAWLVEAAAVDVETAAESVAEVSEPALEAAAVDPSPVIPPVAPVAAIRASASAVVVQVMLVPAELTKGNAAQIVPPAHWVVSNFPPTHCANAPLTQAF